MQNNVQEGNVKNNRTQHIENGAQNTTPTKSRTEHFQNSARGTYQIIKKNTYKTNLKKHNKDCAKGTNVPKN